MTVRFTSEAEADLREIRRWYSERGSGLAGELVGAIDAALVEIERHPKAFIKVHREMRRTLLRRFPYCVFYIDESEWPVVVGCFHARRSPTAWSRRAAT